MNYIEGEHNENISNSFEKREVEFTNLSPEELKVKLEELFNQNQSLFNDNFNLNNLQTSGDTKILKTDYSKSSFVITDITNLSSKDDMMKKMKELMDQQDSLFNDNMMLSGDTIESIKLKYNIVETNIEMDYEKNVSYTNLNQTQMEELYAQNQKLITGNFNNED